MSNSNHLHGATFSTIHHPYCKRQAADGLFFFTERMNLRSSTRLSRVFLVLTIVNDPIEYSIFGWKQKKKFDLKTFIFKGKIWLWFYFLGVWHSVPIKTCLGKWRAYFLWGDQEKKKENEEEKCFKNFVNMKIFTVYLFMSSVMLTELFLSKPPFLKTCKWRSDENLKKSDWDLLSVPVRLKGDHNWTTATHLRSSQQSTHLAGYSVEKSDRLNLTFDRGISRRMSMLVRMIEVIFDISWASWLLMETSSV